jgi:predicted Zn-ribbon and HTH transcriptional regulator
MKSKPTRKRTPKNVLARKPARTRKVVRTTLIPEYYCKKCGHSWIPRTNIPDECPNCKSRNWLVKR